MQAPPGRDLDHTRQQLERWLVSKLPAASQVRVSALARPSATGYSNDTLLFDLCWREEGQPRQAGRVVRIEPRGYPVFPRYDVGRQHRILDILGRTDVPVPKVFWLESDAAVLGAPFYLMERVDGQIPADNPPYHASGWLAEIAAEERAALWWSGLEVLARIHNLDWRALGLGFLVCPAPGATPLERQLADYERFLGWAARGRPQPTAEAALRWLEAHRPAGEERVALCWGDARLGNLIFREGRCAAVLDWEMAVLGNPEADLAWWLFLDRHHSEGVGRPRLPGFPERDETIARYEQWTGRAVRRLDYYEVFAGFRFAVIMIRLAQQLVVHGLLPPDSDFETNNIVTRLLARLLRLPPPDAHG